MTDEPIRARWLQGAFHPVGNWSPAWCHDHLEEGETLTLEVERGRSMKSHRHQFAWVKDAWANLPERMAEMPYARSPETLRKHALCATGYCDVATYDLGSKAAAERMAPVLEADGTKAHGYCIVTVRGPMIERITPQSQSVRAMGGDRFKASKNDILDWIAGLLDVSPEDLRRAA